MKTMAALVAMLAIAGTAFAQDKDKKPAAAAPPAAGAPAAPPKAAPLAPPKPGPELDALKPLVKNWSCKGSGTIPGPTPVTFTYTSKVSAKWDLGNFWADWKYDRAKVKDVPGLIAEGEWGYDVTSKKYIMQGMDNWGGWINVTSAGPSGDTFVFEGESAMLGQKVPSKMTFQADPKGKKVHFTLEAGGAKIVDDDCK